MEVEKIKLYSDFVYRQETAKKLLFFADESLKGGVYFKDFEIFKAKIISNDFANNEMAKFYCQFLFENLRITTFFENFLKAFLLLNGKVVHNILESKSKDLCKKQKHEPIDISLITDLTFLGSNTIGVGSLQKESYCQVVGLDIDMMKKLIPIFNYRNKVHFYLGETIEDLKGFIELYDKIIKISSNNIDSTMWQIERVIDDLKNLKNSTL